jgi:hypothetical protein
MLDASLEKLNSVEYNEVLDLVILSDQQKKEECYKGFEDGAKAASDDILSSI